MSTFRKGDKVKCINVDFCAKGYLTLGSTYTVSEDLPDNHWLRLEGVQHPCTAWNYSRFELVADKPAKSLYIRHRPAGKESNAYTDVKPVASIAEGAAYIAQSGRSFGVYEIISYATVATFEVIESVSREVRALP